MSARMLRRRAAWSRQPLCVAALLLASCNPAGTTTVPTRAGGTRSAGLGIPYPVSDVEKVEGWSRAVLSRSTFAVVLTRAEADAFPRRVAGSGPVMVGQQIREKDDDGAAYNALLQRAFRGKRPNKAAAVRVPAPVLATLGHRPPAPTVFLVSPDGNCAANVGDANVGHYDADGPVLQIDWILTGCDPQTPWAPVGVIGDYLAQDTVWVAAEVGLDARFDVPPGWQGPLASALAPPVWSSDVPVTLQIVRVLQIPGAVPTVVQVYDSLVDLADDETRAQWTANGLDPACADRHATAMSHGFWNGNALDPFDPGQSGDEPHLLGAFVRGAQIDGLVYDHRLDALVAIPPAPTLQGEGPWVRRSLPSGVHSTYARASWGYLPTSDLSPVGEPCALPTE